MPPAFMALCIDTLTFDWSAIYHCQLHSWTSEAPHWAWANPEKLCVQMYGNVCKLIVTITPRYFSILSCLAFFPTCQFNLLIPMSATSPASRSLNGRTKPSQLNIGPVSCTGELAVPLDFNAVPTTPGSSSQGFYK